MFQSFLKTKVQSATFYLIRVDNVNLSKMLDPITGLVFSNIASPISEKRRNLSVSRIFQLSRPGKKYSSMIFYLKEKSQENSMIAGGFWEIRRNNNNNEAWKNREKIEQKCFSCQWQDFLECSIKKVIGCDNCAKTWDHHWENHILRPKYTKCESNHTV